MNSFTNLIFSDDCAYCSNKRISPDIPLCKDCYYKIKYVSKYCPICGRASNGYCEDCIKNNFSFDYSRSVVYYNEVSGALIKKFKYNGRMNIGFYMASLMYSKLINDNVLSNAKYLTYIPFNYWKKYNRLYNHSQILCTLLSEMTGLEIIDDLINAKFSLINQAKLPIKWRKKRHNLFKKGKNHIKGENIIIIDDVITSGKTLSDAAKIIKENNNIEKVFCLTFAAK